MRDESVERVLAMSSRHIVEDEEKYGKTIAQSISMARGSLAWAINLVGNTEDAQAMLTRFQRQMQEMLNLITEECNKE